ncbi:hypothetical protein [Caenibius sp. WL]|uniref:ATP-dependent DNA ligase n=1 Tax=Caenibius sp. WL TaxID=2872646 RepID=UPI001C990532|nr:hypothetical protein [Caenibius sp. WL]QZP06772.1 hypothetical protein K5X80_08530 [Caenibius sp. WL]
MNAQLCQLAQDWRGDLPAGGAMIEPKIDGWRALYFRGIDGQPRLWTRGGHPIEGVGHILHRCRLMESMAGHPLFIDGEFQVDGSLAATKAWCERGWRFGGEAGLFHMFDVMPHSEWIAGGTDRPLHERKAMLADLARQVEEDPSLSWEWRPGSHGRDGEASPLIIMPDSWAFDAGDVLDAANRIWAAGGEGCMIKDADSPYQRNRCGSWRKVKAENQHKWQTLRNNQTVEGRYYG